jgi:8-oxo-dGTP pyrophosphatase MutT (NUDIX family)
MINPGFTLCFLLNGDDVLLIHRRFPPNEGRWNGVGGHVEPGETPRQAVIREVAEETGYRITDPHFAGLLTWDGFEIPPGAIAIFTAEVPTRVFEMNHEGELAWKPREWACTSAQVVDNIHVFLPKILAGESPQHFHFSYKDDVRIRDEIMALPEAFDPEKAYWHEAITIPEERRGPYLLSMDKDRLQIEVIEDFLANQSYWARGRALDVIASSMRHSFCFGIYCQGHQVAFARVVTDQATFAWVCDVFVDQAHRRQGLGKWLVDAICQFVDKIGITKTILATRNAQGFYATYGGFEVLDHPERWMSRLGKETQV